jgi:hypothetical protein
MFDRAGWLALVLVTASLAGCTTLFASAPERLQSQAEEAAAGLEDPQAALEAGYRPAAFCLPGEGVHWIDEDLVDDELDPDEPEALLFEPQTSRVEASSADDQRFLGVAYLAPATENETAPTIEGQRLEGPREDLSPTLGSLAELHVYLDEDVRDQLDSDDLFPRRTDAVSCPDGTIPPTAYEQRSPQQEEVESCEEVLTGERAHDHARIELYLGTEDPYDLSPERYQLADRSVHFEAGERDAGGAIVHLHEAGATLGCMLETLGWQVEADRIVTDTGETHEATAQAPFEVFVDGDTSSQGLNTPLEHDRTYVLRHDSTAPPTPCPNVGGPAVHEHAQLDVRLNASEPWDFSADRYQHQASAVALEDGAEDADGARIHVHEDRPTLGCLLATLGWETAGHRIETDTGHVFEATNGTPIEVLVDGEPVEDGFAEPIRNAHTYEVRYNATASD